jgi:hypothetical protein
VHDDVTVCIPTFPGRERFAARAAASAEGQARVLVHCDAYQPQSRNRAYLTWWEAIYRAATPYVVLLFDDDWLGPGCVGALRPLMTGDAAYVVGQAKIRFEDGQKDKLNLDWPEPTGSLDALIVEERLMRRMRLTISPGCCLFRRADALSCLLVGGVPLLPPGPYANAGADLIMMLLPLLKYPRVGWVKEPLLNFSAGPQSTTLEALQTDAGRDALFAAYNVARQFYHALRGGRRCA